jgi:hypothetical protein
VLGLGGAVFLIWAGLWIGLRRPRRDADDADRVPCPFCAEKIKPEASRCPFCRSDLAAGRPSDARLPRRRPF